MKLLFALTLSALLVTGCSDSSTQSPTNTGSDSSQDGGSNQDDSGTGDTGSGSDTSSGGGTTGSGSSDDAGDSTGNGDDGTGDGTSSNGGSDDSGSSADNGGSDNGGGGSTDNTGGGTTVDPGPVLSYYSGSDFNYPNTSGPFHTQVEDLRNLYSVRAPSRVEAQAAIEAMHAANFYRGENKMYLVPSTDIGVIRTHCVDSGEGRFALERCNFYAQSAYDKTMAQDGWQESLLQNTAELICAQSSETCRYSLLNESFNMSLGNGDNDLVSSVYTHNVSPIEEFHWLKVQRRVMAMNRAIRTHAACAGLDTDADGSLYTPMISNGRYASFWAGQYYTIWTFDEDMKADVARETAARTEVSHCNNIMSATILGL